MKTNSGFFDSVEGDKVYGAADFTNVLSDIVADGVSIGQSVDGLTVRGGSAGFTVQPGRAYVEGHWFELTETAELSVSSSSSDRNVYIAVVEGSRELTLETYDEGSEPDTAYLNLAVGVVRAGASTVSNSDITDLRTFATGEKIIENRSALGTADSVYMLSGLKIGKITTDVSGVMWSGTEGSFYVPVPGTMRKLMVNASNTGWKAQTLVFATGTAVTSSGTKDIHIGFSGIEDEMGITAKLKFRARSFESISTTEVHIGMLIVQFG